jgi:hypothetical protein
MECEFCRIPRLSSGGVSIEKTKLPEGTRVLVTLLPEDETEFWLQASKVTLDSVWDNTEDDVYAQILEK